MSFTIKVKEEIIAASSKDKAELSALIKMSGSVGLTNQWSFIRSTCRWM